MPDKAGAKKAMSEANVDFKAGNYDGALEKYTKAIELDPDEVMYPANRANVNLKKENWTAAEEDCSNALKLKPTHAKVGRTKNSVFLFLLDVKQWFCFLKPLMA